MNMIHVLNEVLKNLQVHCETNKRNFINSNTDGFTAAVSNSSLNLYEIILIAQEIKYLGIFEGFFLFYRENVLESLKEAILMSTHNILSLYRRLNRHS